MMTISSTIYPSRPSIIMPARKSLTERRIWWSRWANCSYNCNSTRPSSRIWRMKWKILGRWLRRKETKKLACIEIGQMYIGKKPMIRSNRSTVSRKSTTNLKLATVNWCKSSKNTKKIKTYGEAKNKSSSKWRKNWTYFRSKSHNLKKR